MTNKLLITQADGTPKSLVFGDHATDFSPTAANDLRDATAGNRTNVQIITTSLADGAARQSAKGDLGTDFAQAYNVRGAIEFAATPVTGDIVEFYWAPSQASTAANANPGGVAGADSAYAGYSANLSESVLQLEYIGAFVVTVQVTTTVQIAEIGVFSPTERYGTLVIKNESAAAFHSDDVETHIVFDPIVPEVQ
jgi:hypothetical protein